MFGLCFSFFSLQIVLGLAFVYPPLAPLSRVRPSPHANNKTQPNPNQLILYKRYKLSSTIDSPFRNVDRVKLINAIFQQPATGDVPGCGFELSRLQEKGCLLGYFSLHDMPNKIALEKKWLAINSMPHQQPIEQIKDYFGEKIALYFGWLGVYTTFLGYASAAALVAYVWSAAEGRTDSLVTPYFASFMALWSTVFLEAWKRQEATYRVEWGMAGFEQLESTRPAYWGFQRTKEGAQVTSHVDGAPTVHFPAAESVKRKVLGNVVTAAFIVVVCVVVFSIFGLKNTMQSALSKKATEQNTILPFSSFDCSVLFFCFFSLERRFRFDRLCVCVCCLLRFPRAALLFYICFQTSRTVLSSPSCRP
jgi:hypothetical protein